MSGATGVFEWADRNCNLAGQVGCENRCLYCYAAEMAVRYGRALPGGWGKPTHGAARPLPRRRKPGVTMFPTAHDVTPENAHACLYQAGYILDSGDNLLLVTKARRDALRVILEAPAMLARRERVEIRVTLGSIFESELRKWEPGAPSGEERLAALTMAHGMGYRTSVSAEPLLDLGPKLLIDAVRPVTSCIWLGLMKDARRRVAATRPGDKEAAAMVEEYLYWRDRDWTARLYRSWKDDPFIKWKDSIRAVVNFNEHLKGGGHAPR